MTAVKAADFSVPHLTVAKASALRTADNIGRKDIIVPRVTPLRGCAAALRDPSARLLASIADGGSLNHAGSTTLPCLTPHGAIRRRHVSLSSIERLP